VGRLVGAVVGLCRFGAANRPLYSVQQSSLHRRRSGQRLYHWDNACGGGCAGRDTSGTLAAGSRSVLCIYLLLPLLISLWTPLCSARPPHDPASTNTHRTCVRRLWIRRSASLTGSGVLSVDLWVRWLV